MIPHQRLPKKKVRALIKCFALDLTALQTKQMCKVDKNTANLWFRYFREQIYIASTRAPRLAGEVEIDQAFFGGRGKKKDAALVRRLAGLPTREILKRSKKLKPTPRTQVIGILERGGRIYVQPIPKADANTLLPIIHLVIEPGSTIYTDMWGGFNKLKLEKYTHKSINHATEYSNRKGVHINGVEAFWSFAKHRLDKFKGIPKVTALLHLKECEFRYNNKDVAKALKVLLK